MKQHYFLSGLPRSGSTVLSAILNQNPAVYVTPTSPLLDQLINNQGVWHQVQAVKANPVPEQLTNITKRLIDAIWNHIDKPIIIDKNRGWGKNWPASNILFGDKIKVIATTRDIPSIMASWLTLLSKNPDSYMDKILLENGLEINDENRMMEMWNHMVLDCVEGLEQLKKDAGEYLHLVDYDRLVTEPTMVMKEIEKFLELPEYCYDFENINSNTMDDDLAAWGLVGMHTIRTKLQKTTKSAQEILGNDLYQKFLAIQERVSNGKFKFSS